MQINSTLRFFWSSSLLRSKSSPYLSYWHSLSLHKQFWIQICVAQDIFCLFFHLVFVQPHCAVTYWRWFEVVLTVFVTSTVFFFLNNFFLLNLFEQRKYCCHWCWCFCDCCCYYCLMSISLLLIYNFLLLPLLSFVCITAISYYAEIYVILCLYFQYKLFSCCCLGIFVWFVLLLLVYII